MVHPKAEHKFNICSIQNTCQIKSTHAYIIGSVFEYFEMRPQKLKTKERMGCLDRLIIFILSTILIIHYNVLCTTAQVPYYIDHNCLGANFTAKSTYQTNLNLLFSSLTSSFNNNTVLKNGYRNVTIGRNPDIVYGSLLCTGDVISELCQLCVDTAVKEIVKPDFCPNSEGAIIWYNECMLRYSNESYFSTMDEDPGVYLANEANITNPDQFFDVLANLLDDLVVQAVQTNDSSSTLFFATGDRNYTRFQKVYGLVQCTPDLSSSNCNRCLRVAIADLSSCCDGKIGGRVVLPSCNFRYEIYPFYQPKVIAEPPPSPTSPPLVLPRGTTNSTTTNAKGKSSSKVAVIIAVPLVIAVVLSFIAIWCFRFQRKKIKHKFNVQDVDHEIQSAESLQFHFNTVSAATDNFSDANKLGEGGFGCVYKGALSDGQEIAVKRLSRHSGQGDQEFKNEVVLVAKLQHRNLVRLLGFSLHGEEKLLIYELMPNASLDHFIFDPVKRTYLDWERRYKIIGGIARGLLYLHEDSRVRIIHRDLKASNILLGADMIPKISDFGMARLFVMDQTQANTKRIVGTYGYMAPEYAMHGHFSVKSDVFSFGVIVLEILTGQKNNSFYESVVGGAQDLLSYAWGLWENGKALELLDPTLKDNCSTSEVMRCIHIGLLCVQDSIADRPTMASVILMLNSNSITLQLPSRPAYYVADQPIEEGWSTNEVSLTELDAR